MDQNLNNLSDRKSPEKNCGTLKPKIKVNLEDIVQEEKVLANEDLGFNTPPQNPKNLSSKKWPSLSSQELPAYQLRSSPHSINSINPQQEPLQSLNPYSSILKFPKLSISSISSYPDIPLVPQSPPNQAFKSGPLNILQDKFCLFPAVQNLKTQIEMLSISNEDPGPNLSPKSDSSLNQMVENIKSQETSGLIKIPLRIYVIPALDQKQISHENIQDPNFNQIKNSNLKIVALDYEEGNIECKSKQNVIKKRKNKRKKNKVKLVDDKNELQDWINLKTEEYLGLDEVKSFESKKLRIEDLINQIREKVKIKIDCRVKMVLDEGKNELGHLDYIEKLFIEMIRPEKHELINKNFSGVNKSDESSKESNIFSSNSSKNDLQIPENTKITKMSQISQNIGNLPILTSYKDKIFISKDLKTVEKLTSTKLPNGSSKLFLFPNIICFYNSLTQEVTSIDYITLTQIFKVKSSLKRRFCTFGLIDSSPALIGGIDESSKLISHVEVLKKFSKFEPICPIVHPRSHGQFIVHQQKTYLFMGNPPNVNQIIEKFEKNVWVACSIKLPYSIKNSITVSYNHQIIFLGGEDKLKNQMTNVFSFDTHSNKIVYSGLTDFCILAGECMNNAVIDGVLYVLDYKHGSLLSQILNIA